VSIFFAQSPVGDLKKSDYIQNLIPYLPTTNKVQFNKRKGFQRIALTGGGAEMSDNISFQAPVGTPLGRNAQTKTQKWVRRLLSQRYLQLMALLGVAWMIIFNYIPMYGTIIAFKNFNIIKSIGEAPWAGMEHFKAVMEDENLSYVIKNTLGISLLKLVIGFPLPIIFALFLNELRGIRFKKLVQTISYMPHFLSWVILGGILATWLADVGIINHLLKALHLINEPISYLAEPSYFWGIVVSSDLWKELGWSAIIYIAGAFPEDAVRDAAVDSGHNRHFVHLVCKRNPEFEFRPDSRASQSAERDLKQRDRRLCVPDGDHIRQVFLLHCGGLDQVGRRLVPAADR
jgi:ABC-type sugar transport system permease subunit